MNLTNLLYEGFITASAPLVGVGLSLHQRGKILLSQRFGNDINLPVKCDFWGHGASAGEVKGLMPILKLLAPKENLFVTMTSPTGFESLGGVQGALLPFDSRVYLRSLVDKVKCKAFIIGESEFWPVLIEQLHRRNIKIILINGRITESTYKRFSNFNIFKDAISKINLFCVEDERSKNYLLKLGLDKDRIFVTGNAKYDSHLPDITEERKHELLNLFKLSNNKICTIGSIRPGEEVTLFPAIAKLINSNSGYSFIIAPRHKEKFKYFADKLTDNKISFSKFSDQARGNSDVLLLDTFGKLEDAYSISHAAVIGGTFIPDIGGHNPLEAAEFGIPVVVGKYHSKIEPLIGDGKNIGIINTSDELINFLNLVSDDSVKDDLGQKAKDIWIKQQGVAKNTSELISRVIS